jgi:hypothetical protein
MSTMHVSLEVVRQNAVTEQNKVFTTPAECIYLRRTHREAKRYKKTYIETDRATLAEREPLFNQQPANLPAHR